MTFNPKNILIKDCRFVKENDWDRAVFIQRMCRATIKLPEETSLEKHENTLM